MTQVLASRYRHYRLAEPPSGLRKGSTHALDGQLDMPRHG